MTDRHFGRITQDIVLIGVGLLNLAKP